MATDGYLILADIIREIQNYKRTHGRDPRIAISLTGGGARGAYEAGVAEALLQMLLPAGIRPAILCGTSAGGIVATGFFADLLYSSFPPPPSRIYAGQQSLLWRSISDGNNGVGLIAGDRAWVLKWLTKEEGLTAFDNFDASVNALESAVNNLKLDMTRLKTDLALLPQSVLTFDNMLKVRAPDLNQADGKLGADINNLTSDARAMNVAWGDVNLLFPGRTLKAIQKFDDALGKFVVDYGNAIVNLSTGVASAALTTALNGLTTLLSDTEAFVTTVSSELQAVAADMEALVNDDLSFSGSMLKLVNAAADLIAFLRDLKARVLSIIIVKDSQGSDTLTDHVLPNTRLHNLIQGFLETTFLSSGRPRPVGVDIQRAILADWSARANAGENVPELFLTAANITASRLSVFAIAGAESVTSLAKQGFWTVDLTGRAPLGENVLWPKPGVEGQLLADAAVTSSAIPVAFPPVKWDLVLGQPPAPGMPSEPGMLVKQTFVDGGVLDSSPIDIAIAAGATHVISIELSPLVDFLFRPIDTQQYNAFTILWAAFQSAMDGNLRSSISATVISNTKVEAGNPSVEIYRLAPLIPAYDSLGQPLSPSTYEFDGVFDGSHKRLMSVYDWFMQGYVDAKGLDATSFPKDLIVLDYQNGFNPSPRGYVGTAEPGIQGVKMNKFWRASTDAWPTQLPS